MSVVRFGNTAPVDRVRNADDPDDPGERVSIDVGDEGHRVTEVRVPKGTPLGEALAAITAPERGVWDNHSDAPPAWVSSDDEQLAAVLASHFTVGDHVCEVVAHEEGDDPVGLGLADKVEGNEPDSKPARGRRRAAHDDEEA